MEILLTIYLTGLTLMLSGALVAYARGGYDGDDKGSRGWFIVGVVLAGIVWPVLFPLVLLGRLSD